MFDHAVMSLDPRTMIVMMSVLSLSFSGLLALAGLHADNIRGIRLWALASLMISVGFSTAYIMFEPGNGWLITGSATLVGTGMSLQYTGIQAFKTGAFNWRIPCLMAVWMFLQNTWFNTIHPDVQARIIANSLLMVLINAVCARALLIRIESPLRTAYWFTGGVFVTQACMLLARVAWVCQAPPGTYGLYAQAPFNPLLFFISSLTELFVTFGFVLMLNYRLATDLHKLAMRDGLTGALNRRCLEDEAVHLQARCRRTGETLAVMMIDIDHFKAVNDQYGHPAGDEILRHLTAVALATIRNDDYFARYGGEEFCVLLPAGNEAEAGELAERLRKNYAATRIEFGGVSLASTISIGVADSSRLGLDFAALVAAADQAMYRAKQEGRNRVVRYSGRVGTKVENEGIVL